MKKRNTTIFAFLLLAAVGMGVGYAALTDSLTFGGSAAAVADADAWESNIHFAAAETQANAKAEYEVDATGDAATLTVSGMEAKNETIVVKMAIVNENTDYDAKLDVTSAWTVTPGANTVASDFTITCPELVDDAIVPKNGQLEFTVTIKLNVQPTENLSATFNIAFDAIAVDPVTRA